MKIGIRLLAVILIFFKMGLIGAEDLVVTARGEAPGTGPAAVERAREEALRNAVEKGFGVYVTSATLVENAGLISDDILAETRGFVRSYEILEESESAGMTVLLLRAVISLDRIWESDSLKLLLARMDMPGFAIRSAESVGDQLLADCPAGNQLMDHLVSLGFKLVGRCQAQSAGEASQVLADIPSDVEYLVWVRGDSSFKKESQVMGRTMLFFDGRVNVQVLQRDSGRVIASAGGRNTRSSQDELTAISSSLAAAVLDCGDELVRQMLSSWTETLNMGRPIEIEARGVTLTELSGLAHKLQTVPGLHDIKRRAFSSSTGLLQLRSKLKTLELAEIIEDHAGWQVVEVSASRIVVHLGN